MADTDAMAALRRYVGEPLVLPAPPDFDDDDELELADDEESDDEESDDDDDDDDEGEPGDDEEEEGDEEAPGTPILTRARRVVGAVIPQRLVQRVANAPTPTGLFGAIVVLAILTVLLVPANTNGATRLELLWRALTGGVTLPSGPHAQAADAASGVSAEVQQVEQAVAAGWQTFWDAESGM